MLYALKVAGFIAAWVFFCGRSPSLGPPEALSDWWLRPLAFQKAILWATLFELLGLGCGSGPLTGRYLPPVGGPLYWLRPGTTRLPIFSRARWIGGHRRRWVEVGLYAALLQALLQALLAPALSLGLLLPVVLLLPLLGVLDKTIFLAARAEHYWVTAVCFLSPDWIGGAMAVQAALWTWAGVSKLNPHFPSVVGVMLANSPLAPRRLKHAMVRDFPRDLNPSPLARRMAHAGAALELAVPAVLVLNNALGGEGLGLLLGLGLMLALHGFITSHVPAGVPLEWNVVVAYGGFALFYAHPEVGVFGVSSPALALFLAAWTVGVPLLGHLRPRLVSFLLAMRYYAGNWPWSVYLFKGEAFRKLDGVCKSAPSLYAQIELVYPHEVAVGLVGRVMGFRMMHLHGRLLPRLIPRLLPDAARLEDVHWVDGELIGGLVLGWNFGDGHLHQEQLLQALQAECGFEPGELRCLFVESQALGGRVLPWRLVDAATGELERGETAVAELERGQAWEAAG